MHLQQSTPIESGSNPVQPEPNQAPVIEPSSSKPKLNTKLLGLFALLVLIAAVPLSVFVSQQEQDPRQQAANPKLPQYKVFVTSATSSANLGGIAGADTKCQQLATAATLPGRWIAWLSDATTNAKDRIVDAEYLRIDGRRVAKNKADLLDSKIKKELFLDEKLAKVESTVWTGTKANGEKSSNTCNSWTEETNAVKALIGVTSERNDGDWTEENPNHSCAPEFKMRFYCFQQPTATASTPTPTNNPSITPSPSVTPTITPTPTIPPKLNVFLSSTGTTGNIGGLAGADAKCQQLANAQQIGGQWVAWLSDSTHDAKDRIPDTKYELLDGTPVANSKSDLTDGTIVHGINMNEKRETTTAAFPWTGTSGSGTKVANSSCNNWTSADPTLTATKGSGTHNSNGWTAVGTGACHEPQGLYCFQTALPPAATPTPGGDNGSTNLDFTITLDGIGAPLGNPTPKAPTRTLKVEIYDSANQPVGTFTGNIVFQGAAGANFQRFKGTVNVGTLPAARYNIRIKTDKYLAKVIPNQTLGAGTLVMPGVKLIAGDVNDDNKIDIADLHLVERACPGKLLTDPRCSQADVNDDGKIEIVTDANIIFSNMAVRLGE